MCLLKKTTTNKISLVKKIINYYSTKEINVF